MIDVKIKVRELAERLHRMDTVNITAMMFGASSIMRKHIIGEVDRQHQEGKTMIRTANYRNSIKNTAEGKTAIVYSGVKYSIYLEDGTDPYIITPKRKKALAFDKGGRHVVVKKVLHPGIEGRHIFRNGLGTSIDEVGGFLTSTLTEART